MFLVSTWICVEAAARCFFWDSHRPKILSSSVLNVMCDMKELGSFTMEHMKIMFWGLVWSRRPENSAPHQEWRAELQHSCWQVLAPWWFVTPVALLRWPSWPWSHESKGILGFSLMISIWRRETSELQDLVVFFIVLLRSEILHHVGCRKLCKSSWDHLSISIWTVSPSPLFKGARREVCPRPVRQVAGLMLLNLGGWRTTCWRMC